MQNDTPRPFLKWAGGKNQLLDELEGSLPSRFGRYFEPFVGGGALFFHLRRTRFNGEATLSDLNRELIDAYLTVRESVDELIEELQHGGYESRKDTFYSIRSWDRELDWAEVDSVRRCARMIYLNHTCYNGLYRVNQKGQFNVPFGGYKNPTICDEENLRAVSRALRNVTILCADFGEATDAAGAKDLVYFDPPYQPVSDTSSFTEYTAGGFGENEQRRLADVFDALHHRGCYILESNSLSPLIRELYSGKDYVLEVVQAKRAISCDPKGRGAVSEYLIRNYSDTVQARLHD